MLGLLKAVKVLLLSCYWILSAQSHLNPNNYKVELIQKMFFPLHLCDSRYFLDQLTT